jgi:hypothetical protein
MINVRIGRMINVFIGREKTHIGFLLNEPYSSLPWVAYSPTGRRQFFKSRKAATAWLKEQQHDLG